MFDLITQVPALVPLAGDGILGTVDNLSQRALATVRTVSTVAAVVGVLVIFLISKFSLMKTIMAGLVAGLLLWFVFNITTVKDRVDGDLKSAPALGATQSPHQPS